MSKKTGEEAAVGAMKAGASNYITKGKPKYPAPAAKMEIPDAQARRERLPSVADLMTKEEELRRKHTRHLAILNRISESISQSKDFNTLLKKALDGLIKALRFSSGALFLRDATNGEFRLAVHRGIGPESARILNKIVDLHAKDTKKSNFLKRLLDHTSVTDIRELGLQTRHACFVVSVPLKSAGKTLAIALFPSRSREAHSKEEKQLLNTIRIQMGAAIENALLLQKMSELSTTDELTRLYNRRHFQKALEIEIARARRYDRPMSVALLDVDSFKEINDRYGHATGDSVLRSLARTMTSNLRKTDVAFRYGGDEFAVILPETTSDKAKDAIERVRLKWFRMPKTDLVLENPLGFSAGIAEYPRNAEKQDNLVFLLDAALYCSKRSGGNRSTLVSEMGERPQDVLGGSPSDQGYALTAGSDDE